MPRLASSVRLEERVEDCHGEKVAELGRNRRNMARVVVAESRKVVGVDRFGFSAPGDIVMKELGMTAENLSAEIASMS